LHKSGKEVYYVTENPELSILPRACIPRPFRTWYQNCDVDLNVVKKLQEQYLVNVRNLRNVTIVNTIPGFCSETKCTAIRDGTLLYADYSHLSIAGSRFQANVLLKHFLETSADAVVDNSVGEE
jgi:SGNH domain (fused to AT3 domains)